MAQAANKTRKVFDNRYEILSIVGRGHCSVVYHARHVMQPSSELALKVLLHQKDQRSNAERLRREALAMVSSRHRYVIRLDDFHSVGDLCYLSMEYAAESDVRKYVSKHNGILNAKQGESFLLQMAEALGFMHKAGIIHRDMKPDNILVINDRETRLGDFGVAVLPGTDSSLDELQRGIGTMDYMAPEVLEGIRYDTLCDLYALGVSFYELLSGKHPFAQASLLEQIEVRKEDRTPHICDVAPHTPHYLGDAIMRLMRYDPAARFKDARELVQSILKSKAQGAKSKRTGEKETKEKTENGPSSYGIRRADSARRRSIENDTNPLAAAAEALGASTLLRSSEANPAEQQTTLSATAGFDPVPAKPEVTTPLSRPGINHALQNAGTPSPWDRGDGDKQIAVLSPNEVLNSSETVAIDPLVSANPTPVDDPFTIGARPETESRPLDNTWGHSSEDDLTGDAPMSSSTAANSTERSSGMPQNLTGSSATSSRVSRSKTMRIDREMVEKVRAQARVGGRQEQEEDNPNQSMPQDGSQNGADVAPPPPAAPAVRRSVKNAVVLATIVAGLVCGIAAVMYIGIGRSSSPAQSTARAPVAQSNVALIYPQLPGGIYAGTISGLIGNRDVPFSILSFSGKRRLIFMIGIEGWVPAEVNLSEWEQAKDALKPLRLSSAGFILEWSGQAKDGALIGNFVNLITGDEGAWRAVAIKIASTKSETESKSGAEGNLNQSNAAVAAPQTAAGAPPLEDASSPAALASNPIASGPIAADSGASETGASETGASETNPAGSSAAEGAQ